MQPYTEDCLPAFLSPLRPTASGARITLQRTLALSRHLGRAGVEALTAQGQGMRGGYLMSPLGGRAGQSSHRPLHARGAGESALRHKSSSSFLPAASTSSSVLPGRQRWAGAALAALPAQRGGRKGGNEGPREGGEGTVPSLSPPHAARRSAGLRAAGYLVSQLPRRKRESTIGRTAASERALGPPWL